MAMSFSVNPVIDYSSLPLVSPCRSHDPLRELATTGRSSSICTLYVIQYACESIETLVCAVDERKCVLLVLFAVRSQGGIAIVQSQADAAAAGQVLRVLVA